MKMPAALAGRVIYPAHERVFGRPTFDYFAELERTQWLDHAGMESLQLERLRTLLKTAHEHSPWHRERLEAAGLAGGDISCLADLAKLPRMDKRDAAANAARIVWHGVPGGTFAYNTGGSSGQPLRFHFGRRRQASDAAGRLRGRRWWGVNPGDPEVYLWGAPVELNKTDWVKVVRDRLINQLVLNAFEMSPTRMDDYLEAIQQYKPRCVYGYASSLALLAAHAQSRRWPLRLPRLAVVCTTGEPLFEHQRQLIGEVFGAPVANEFGSRDIGFTAHDSPSGQMLLLSESIILEVLDEAGQPVVPGQPGEAVLTGLCSEAQPFIRYRTGDIVRASGKNDRDGRGLHVLDEVVGRSTDFLVRSDGTVMHALAGIYVLRAVRGVGEFKLVQHRATEVEVLVVPGEGWAAESVAAIEAGLRQRMGSDTFVAVRTVDQIAPEASGKHRYVVSHVQLADELARAAHTA
jgi:phenylacetate-CoA ligase